MPDGILIIDKASGWTSMDVCAKLRGILRERRIGHAGTLDPMATGVLPVFIGRATRAVQFAEQGDKEYLAGLRLGTVTNTQDTSGDVLEQCPVSASKADVAAVLPQFTGAIQQIPPMFSAIQVKGQRLYDLARRGVEVERPPRSITIHALALEGTDQSGDYLLRVRCSKGTYVRTLCHDIGQALGCGGCMSSLRRTEAAGFTLAQAVTLDALQAASDPAELILPIDAYFSGRPALVLKDPRAETRFRNGCAVPAPGSAPAGEVRVYGSGRQFLALGRVEQGTLTTIKSFFPVD